MTQDQAITYLAYYGYLAGNLRSESTDPNAKNEMVKSAIMELQKTAGLPATGDLDAATQAKMSQPRCGLIDVRRSVVEFARWQKKNLTYFIERRVSALAASIVDELIGLAWSDWMGVADVKITQAGSASDADMIVSTGSGRADGFDGPSGVLAWAYLPSGEDGQLLMRFDASESWLKEPGNGILLRNVACHEFGHLLGLEHSKVSSALMAPFYNPAVVSPRSSDDIPRIQALYGKPTTVPTPGLPPNMIRLATAVEKGKQGAFAAGSDMQAGDYLALLGGDGPPPSIT